MWLPPLPAWCHGAYGRSPDIHSADVTEEWNPPIPEEPFVGRVRIADAFFGPDAESTDGGKTLTRRIQVVSDLVALCEMRQQCRRGKPFNWNKEEKTANDAILQREDEDIKTRKTSLPCHQYRHGRWRTSAPSVSSRRAFHRRTACGHMRVSTRSGATCSEST